MTRRWLPAAMLVAGGTLLALGLVVILLGWYGAAHTPYLFEQNAYLISGGLFGLGLVVLGGFVFFGAWLARMAADNREAMRQLIRRLEAPSPAGHGESSAALVATPKGSMVHRAGCPLVGRRDDLLPVSADDAAARRPCGVCQPAVPPSPRL